MSKAQVGDLIRITNVPVDWAYDIGGIYEVTEINFSGNPSFNIQGRVGSFYAKEGQYEIFRKAGEEDSEPVDVGDVCTKCNEIVYHLCECQSDVSDAQLTQANRIRAACSELADLLVRKNHDYGDSFSQQYGKYGLMSALIRMDDKMRRLETLQQAESKAQVDESIGDTLLDLAGYALLSYVEQSKTK